MRVPDRRLIAIPKRICTPNGQMHQPSGRHSHYDEYKAIHGRPRALVADGIAIANALEHMSIRHTFFRTGRSSGS
jgi:hypothetical protein